MAVPVSDCGLPRGLSEQTEPNRHAANGCGGWIKVVKWFRLSHKPMWGWQYNKQQFHYSNVKLMFPFHFHPWTIDCTISIIPQGFIWINIVIYIWIMNVRSIILFSWFTSINNFPGIYLRKYGNVLLDLQNAHCIIPCSFYSLGTPRLIIPQWFIRGNMVMYIWTYRMPIISFLVILISGSENYFPRDLFKETW